MAEISTDFSRWPLVVVTPPRAVSDVEMERYMRFFHDEIFARSQPYAVVLDLRITEGVSRRQRGMLTANMGQYENMCRAVAMVFDSRILRGILTAIFWVKKPVYPTRVFTSVVQAIDWAESLVDTTGTTGAEPDDLWSGPMLADTSSSGWVLQSPATIDRAKAESMLDQFAKAGVMATIDSHRRGTVQLYVVRSQPFSDRDQAMQRRNAFSASDFHVNVVGLAEAS